MAGSYQFTLSKIQMLARALNRVEINSFKIITIFIMAMLTILGKLALILSILAYSQPTETVSGLSSQESCSSTKTIATQRILVAPADKLVNQIETSEQMDSVIAPLKDGGYVVVYESTLGANGVDVLARMYYPTGTPMTDEFPVNTVVSKNQNSPSVVGTADGGFAVAWMSDDTVISVGQDVYCRVFYKNGTAKTKQFAVNELTDSNQKTPKIASLTNGNIVIIWNSNDATSTGEDVKSRIFDTNGNPVTSEFRVNTWTTDNQSPSGICGLAYGGFVAQWSSNKQVDGQDVFAKVYENNGAEIFGEFLVNTDVTTHHQTVGGPACLLDGGFVLAWQSEQGTVPEIVAKVYNRDKTIRKSEFVVNTIITGKQTNPTIAPLDQGGFVLAWESDSNLDGDKKGIFSRWFDKNGNILKAADIVVNQFATGDQDSPYVAMVDGGFAVTWTSNNQDADKHGVFLRQYASHLVEQCSTNADCTGTNFTYCNTVSKTCVKCLIDADCPFGQCNPNYGRCFNCYSDSDCDYLPSKPFCDVPSGKCSACLSLGPSLGSTCNITTSPRCDATTRTCTTCLSDGDCIQFPDQPYCKLPDGKCVNCLITGPTTSTCEDVFNARCDIADDTCKPCIVDGDCTHIAGRLTCNATVGVCQECTISPTPPYSSCSDPTKPKCDPFDFTCKACLEEIDCPAGQLCNLTAGLCKNCLFNDVNGSTCLDPDNSQCNFMVDACQPCNSDIDCLQFNDKPFCNTTLHSCKGCLYYGPSSGSSCDDRSLSRCDLLDYSCKICHIDQDCAQFPDTPYCNNTVLGIGTCQSCLRYAKGSNCQAFDSPRCNPSTFICEPCVEDADCPTAKPYCIAGDGICHHCPNAICPKCPNQYLYLDNCYQTCPGGSFPLNNAGTLMCDTCITNSNPTNCTTCNIDQDCDKVPIDNVFCSNHRCTTISVKFNNPLLTIKSQDLSKFFITVRADPNYKLNWTITPADIKFDFLTSGIQVGPLTAEPVPTSIKIKVVATSIYNETAEDSITVTVEIPEAPKEYSAMQKAAVAAAAGAMFISGVDPALIWSLANLMQMFYYLLFLNVDYPKNLRKFLGLFSLGRLNFMPNPLGGVIETIESERLPSPSRFFENSFTGLFVETSGSILSMIMMAVGFDIAANILKCILPKRKDFLQKIINFYEWSGLLRLWMSSYLELMFATLLQLYAFTEATAFYFCSSFIALLIFIANLILPLWCFYILGKIDKNRENIGKYQALTEDYDLLHPVRRNFSIVIIMRRMLQGMLIVFLFYVPMLQVTSVWLVILTHLVMLLIYRPHHRSSLNFLDIIVELNFVIIHSLILPIGYNDVKRIMTQETKETVGWVIIGSSLFVLAIQLVIILKEQFDALKGALKKIRRFIAGLSTSKSAKTQIIKKTLSSNVTVRNRIQVPETKRKLTRKST